MHPASLAMKLPTRPTLDSAATAAMLRKARLASGKTITEVAAIVGVSVAYACDLELGRRKWNDERAKSYLRAINSSREEAENAIIKRAALKLARSITSKPATK